MKWLTLEWIKKHSRIDYDCEDGLLEMYGDSAEDTVLNICNRTYDDLVEVYGHIPAPSIMRLSYWWTPVIPSVRP